MAIQWTPDLATGSDEIDNQHKMIFERIDSLLVACNEGKGKEEMGRIVTFLEDYVKTHFHAEENYMIEHRYPGYNEHTTQHEDFKKQFTDLKKQIETEGAGVHTVIATNQLVVRWFLHHIREVDTQLGAFLKDKRK
jgi:hemerythrin